MKLPDPHRLSEQRILHQRLHPQRSSRTRNPIPFPERFVCWFTVDQPAVVQAPG